MNNINADDFINIKLLSQKDLLFIDNHKFMNIDMNCKLKYTNLSDFYNFLESRLGWIIDDLMKIVLSNIRSDKNFQKTMRCAHGYDFVIVGGKAVNNIVSRKYLKNSFDYDIHLYNNNENYIDSFEIDHFGYFLEKNIKYLFDNDNYFKLLRIYIYKFLLHYDLINDDAPTKEFYMKSQLFYYGSRKKNIIINSMFLHLIFKIDLFKLKDENYLIENINEDTYQKYIYDNDTIQNFYYPFSDISVEGKVNFKIFINKSKYIINYGFPIKLPYYNYPLVLYNLINYSFYCMDVKNDIKLESILNKLLYIIDYKYLSLSFLSSFNLYEQLYDFANYKYFSSDILLREVKYTTHRIIDKKEMRPLDIIFKTKSRKIIDIIKYIITNIMDRYNKDNNSKILISNLKNNNIDKSVNMFNIKCSDIESVINNLTFYTEKYDIHRYLLYSTSNERYLINTFLLNESFKFQNIYNNINIKINYELTYSHKLRVIDKNIIINKQNINTDDIVNNMSNVFKDVRSNNDFINDLNKLNDYFNVFRITSFATLFDYNKDSFPFVFNPGNLDNTKTFLRNGVIFCPMFQYTFFNKNFDLTNINFNDILLNIVISKNSKKWLMLNNYSLNNNKNELIIDKNVYLIILDFNYSNILYKNNVLEIPVLSVLLCDTIEEVTIFLNNKINNESNDLKGGNDNNLFKKTNDFSIFNIKKKDKLILNNVFKLYKNIYEFNIYELLQNNLNNDSRNINYINFIYNITNNEIDNRLLLNSNDNIMNKKINDENNKLLNENIIEDINDNIFLNKYNENIIDDMNVKLI